VEARVGIERGSFTVPSLIHSVSRLIPALFYSGQATFSVVCSTLHIAPLPPPNCQSGEIQVKN